MAGFQSFKNRLRVIQCVNNEVASSLYQAQHLFREEKKASFQFSHVKK